MLESTVYLDEMSRPDMAIETGQLKRTLKDLQERTASLRGFL
jgi:hypothetical protein